MVVEANAGFVPFARKGPIVGELSLEFINPALRITYKM